MKAVVGGVCYSLIYAVRSTEDQPWWILTDDRSPLTHNREERLPLFFGALSKKQTHCFTHGVSQSPQTSSWERMGCCCFSTLRGAAFFVASIHIVSVEEIDNKINTEILQQRDRHEKFMARIRAYLFPLLLYNFISFSQKNAQSRFQDLFILWQMHDVTVFLHFVAHKSSR